MFVKWESIDERFPGRKTGLLHSGTFIISELHASKIRSLRDITSLG